MGLIPRRKSRVQRIYAKLIKCNAMMLLKPYLKFVIFYHFIPTTATFYYLLKTTDPVLSYIIACSFWGTVLYFFKTHNK